MLTKLPFCFLCGHKCMCMLKFIADIQYKSRSDCTGVQVHVASLLYANSKNEIQFNTTLQVLSMTRICQHHKLQTNVMLHSRIFLQYSAHRGFLTYKLRHHSETIKCCHDARYLHICVNRMCQLKYDFQQSHLNRTWSLTFVFLI